MAVTFDSASLRKRCCQGEVHKYTGLKFDTYARQLVCGRIIDKDVF